MKKDYWNGLKDYWNFSKKNKVEILFSFLLLICLLVFIWVNPVFASGGISRLTISIMMVVPLMLIFAIAPLMHRRYLKSIEGKSDWDIAEMSFRQLATLLLAMIVFIVLFSLLKKPLSFSSMEFFSTLVFYAVASILSFAISSLFKRKSPKAIMVGYTSLVSLLILILLYLVNLFTLNSLADLSKEIWVFLIFFLIINLIPCVRYIYKASKQGINPPSL